MTDLLETLDKIESSQVKPADHYSKYTSVQAPLILKLVRAVRALIVYVEPEFLEAAESEVLEILGEGR